MANKSVYIIAGPNGSGKTIFAKKFLPNYVNCQHFVNADLIAQGLSPFSPRLMAMKAGKLVLEQIDELANKNVDFAFETTLAGKSYVRFLNKRFHRGLSNLCKLYRPALDSWMLFDNSSANPALIAEEKEGKIAIAEQELWNDILKGIGVKL